jgi:hypothetical protein
MSDRKLLWLTWYMRIATLFGTLCFLFAAYLRTFVNPDIMDSYTFITTALIGGILFFSTFPGYRIDIRFNQLKKQISERTDSNNALTAGASKKKDVRPLIKFMTILVITLAFIILNFVLGRIANLNGKNLNLFLHMVVITATVLAFNAFLLIYKVDETFKKLEGSISQYKKDQTSKK